MTTQDGFSQDWGHAPPPRRRIGPARAVLIVLGAIIVIIIGVAGGWILTHQQRFADQLTVWGFEPTLTIAGYADRAAMTHEGRFLFYASTPVVASGGDFDAICSNQSEDVGILGCYLHGKKTIYLYDVVDERLDGIEEVVAAHEMLHAVWDRMTKEERQALAPLLEAEALTRSADAEFLETMEFYAEREPGERLNELHSIIGTEFSTISSDLESHYRVYFDDRTAVTGLHESSNAVFIQQQLAIDGIIAQIDALNASVDADYAAYNAGYDELNSDIDNFNYDADNGLVTESQFVERRDDLLRRQDDLDALYISISDRVAQYDSLVAQLDVLNAEVSELNEGINITPRAPEPESTLPPQ